MEGEQQPHRGGGDAATASLLQDQQPPRNKRRAGEFDPLLLSRLASLSACSDDEASDKTAVWPPVSAHDEPAPLSAHNVAADLLPSACVDDGDDEWLSFPVVPTHVPVPSLGAAFASSSPAPPFSLASSSTSVTSSSSGAVPTRGKAAARRYSIAVSSTALRDYAGPRPTNALASAASALPPCSSASPSSSSASAARMAPHNRGRAPTGPLPLPPAGPQPVSVSTTAAAAAALRKESKGEADYQKLRELALKEDFHDLEKRQALYKAGRDTLGRQVVVFTLYNLGDKVDFDRLLLYIIRVMDKLVEEEYALVFCQTHMTTAHRPPFTWLRKAYSMFQRKYKKNLKAAYIIHASTLVRMTLKLFKPFISSKFWKKLVYIDQVTDIYQYIRPDQLTLPDEVLTYNRESRATPLFGLPLAAGCARNLTASSLPIVCERAFEVLDARAVEVEGIFRVSGSTALLNELKQRFDRGEDVDLGFADVHTVAGLLKLYLRELPEPLMTFRLYEPFIAAVRRSREWDETRSEIQALVQELPAENYVLSARLYTLLGRVGANADKNLMNVNNLAIVVGPNVMRAPPDAPADRMITDAGAVNTLVKLLIQHCHVLFPPDTEALL